MPTNPHIDAELLLEDGAQAITATGAGSNTRDVGPGRVPFESAVLVNASAVKTSVGDETYLVYVEGSNDSFSTVVKVGVVEIKAAGRYWIAFSNVQNGVKYREIRAWFVLGGTSPSITSKAWYAPVAQYR